MNNATELVYVVVAVIKNSQNQILIAKRPQHVHQGGLWEFPGGKIDKDEAAETALRRELYEELSIEVISFSELGKIRHDYPDKSVLLEVYLVDNFSGKAYGREGQPVQWVMAEELKHYHFPAANQAIVNMLTLPESCLITGKFDSSEDFCKKLQASLEHGIRLVLLRIKDVDIQTQLELAQQAFNLCQHYHALLLLNPSLGNDHGLDVAGMHLTSHQLFEYKQRPVTKDKFLSASVHNVTELEQAEQLQADFVLLSPVLPTTSHPDAEPLGWDRFKTLADKVNCPVFALGGVDESHLLQARACGAQGIAAISAFWGVKR